MGFADKFLEEAKDRLAKIDAEIEEKIGPLAIEKAEAVATIKRLSRGNGATAKTAPATSDDKLIETVAELSANGERFTTTQIAAHLGVDSRTIARRLAKMGKEGTIDGDKTVGYCAA